MKKLFLFLIVSAFGISSFQEASEDKKKPSKSIFSIVGTKWYREGNNILPGDTLHFINETEVRYYMGELSRTFDSKYELNKDTVFIQTITAALEVNDVEGFEPDLIQKYLISGDSLKLLYLANRRRGEVIEASPNRYKRINDFVKIK